MKNAEENIRQILELLLSGDSYITLEQLSCKADISRRSVQNYLTKIENWLLDNGLDTILLEKRQGNGIRLKADASARQQLLQVLNSTNLHMQKEKIERRLAILKNLVFSNNELTIQYLADQFYISRASIICDLEWAERWLAKYQLRLFKTQRRGTGIVGDEVNRRNAIAGYFDMLSLDTRTLSVKTSGGSRVVSEAISRLLDIYKAEDVKRVCAIIEDAEEQFDFFLYEEYYSSLATHLIISVTRMRGGYPVQKEFLPPEDGDFPQLEMSAAEFIALRLEKAFNIIFPKSERIYICIHLMGYNTFHASMTDDKPVPEKIEQLTMQIIELVDERLHVGFTTDKLLFFGLALHLRAAIYRLKEDIATMSSQPMTFPEGSETLFAAVKETTILYERMFGVKATDSELYSLTYYFLLSKRRNSRPQKGLLICNYGVLSQMELLARLRDNLPQVEIVDVCNSAHVTTYPRAYDFVITTVPLELAGKPIADISHIAKGEDVVFLENFFKTFWTQANPVSNIPEGITV